MASFEPRIIGFLCNWCSYAGADLAGVSRFQYPPNIRIVRVMCSGRVDPDIILEAFKKGADGVFVGGCHFGDCHYIRGNYQAEDKIWVTKKLLKIIDIEPRRLRLEWVSASEGELFAKLIKNFTEEIKELGPLEITDDLALNIKAIQKECTDFRLRWLVGKKRSLTELGNVYNTQVDPAELEQMFEELIRTDFIRNKILIFKTDKN